MRKVIITQTFKNNRTCYGKNISENGSTISFPDISENKEDAKNLSERLSDEDISINHIKDIVKDYFSEKLCDKLIANSLM